MDEGTRRTWFRANAALALARVYALAFAAEGVEIDATRALNLVREAVSRGALSADAAGQDADLASLWGRGDFAQLLKELGHG